MIVVTTAPRTKCKTPGWSSSYIQIAREGNAPSLPDPIVIDCISRHSHFSAEESASSSLSDSTCQGSSCITVNTGWAPCYWFLMSAQPFPALPARTLRLEHTAMNSVLILPVSGPRSHHHQSHHRSQMSVRTGLDHTEAFVWRRPCVKPRRLISQQLGIELWSRFADGLALFVCYTTAR